MPSRNLTYLLLSAVVSLICYETAHHHRYVQILAESIDKIETYYVEPVESRQLFEGSLRGMLNDLDPYSGYIDPQEYAQLLVEIEQHFGGIGIEVGREKDRLTVLHVFPRSPAAAAGLHPGDGIEAINGHSLQGMELNEAVLLMRGPIDEAVTLRMVRGTEPPRELSIVRKSIPLETVRGDRRLADGSWEFYLESQPRWAYIRVMSFGENTADEFAAAWNSVRDRADGLIVDLRGNPGGLLTTAIHICDQFLDKDQVVVSTRDRSGHLDPKYSRDPDRIDPALPVVVLIDRLSASASEIVASCLQDHHRARIVGERSWGKGTVQNIFELEGGKSAMRLTTQTYWRPSGVNIHRRPDDKPEDTWGVQPLVADKVEFTTEEFQKVNEARHRRDYPPRPGERPTGSTPSATDATTGVEPVRDRQLDRAVQVLEELRTARSSTAPPT